MLKERVRTKISVFFVSFPSIISSFLFSCSSLFLFSLILLPLISFWLFYPFLSSFLYIFLLISPLTPLPPLLAFPLLHLLFSIHFFPLFPSFLYSSQLFSVLFPPHFFSFLSFLFFLHLFFHFSLLLFPLLLPT